MSHLQHVFWYELGRNFRRRGFLFATFGIPIIAMVAYLGYRLISAPDTVSSQPPPSASQAAQTNAFGAIRHAGFVDFSGLFGMPTGMRGVLSRYDSIDAAEAALKAGTIDVYYVIAQDYMETGKVQLIMPRFSMSLATDAPIRMMILRQFSRGVDHDVFERLVEPAQISQINLQRDASGQTANNFDADFLVVYIFAVTLMLSVFMTNGYLMQTVIEEKETRMIEVLVSTMRTTHLLAGKILALGALGLLQVVAWLGAVVLLGRLAASDQGGALAALASLQLDPNRVLLLVVYFIFGYLFFAAAYGIVGAISNSMQEGPQFAVIFTLPAVIPLYFLGLFITSPDALLPVFLSLFPVTAPIAMVMRVTLTTVPFWQIALGLALLALLDMVMIWAAGRLFRVQTLLAGNMPRLRDLPKLLRGG